ncbi:MAG: hypothetical protein KZQ93_07900 [Candidatus Thiodiazotropha sp. (ex Monitilora ramsayi)]|nr:hypothetical protein [Candidatus Thiodiazotropha sp. (ex Monitilora ramsayi)]
MRKISGSTFYFKKLFPALWFGFLAVLFVTSFSSGAEDESIMFLAMPILLAVFGYVLFKKMVWDLADEVYDHGDMLEFRKSGKTQRVNLKDIINIDYTHMSSPERVVVHTKKEGEIGNELPFSLPMRFNPFVKNPLVRELIERVDDAKNT